METQQLSGTKAVIIIAMAVQVCIMLVIVVKRQIMRFALRNRRGPHTHIGQGAPKMLRRETDRQLDFVAYIRHEPKPFELDNDSAGHSMINYRIAALKELRSLEEDIASYNTSYLRPPCGNMRSFLLNCTQGPLLGVDSHRIHLLCDDYEHARHHYESFDEAKFKVFLSRLDEMRQAIQKNRERKPFPSPSLPSAARPKKAKMRRKSEEKFSSSGTIVSQQESKTALLVTASQHCGSDSTAV